MLMPNWMPDAMAAVSMKVDLYHALRISSLLVAVLILSGLLQSFSLEIWNLLFSGTVIMMPLQEYHLEETGQEVHSPHYAWSKLSQWNQMIDWPQDVIFRQPALQQHLNLILPEVFSGMSY